MKRGSEPEPVKEALGGTDRPAHRMSSAVRDRGEGEPHLGRPAALHLHFARLHAEVWCGHTDAVGPLRQRAAGGAVVAGRERGDQGIL